MTIAGASVEARPARGRAERRPDLGRSVERALRGAANVGTPGQIQSCGAPWQRADLVGCGTPEPGSVSTDLPNSSWPAQAHVTS